MVSPGRRPAGYPDAQNNLGVMYEEQPWRARTRAPSKPQLVSQSRRAGRCRRPAQPRQPSSSGPGVTQEPRVGRPMVSKAANQRHPMAQSQSGRHVRALDAVSCRISMRRRCGSFSPRRSSRPRRRRAGASWRQNRDQLALKSDVGSGRGSAPSSPANGDPQMTAAAEGVPGVRSRRSTGPNRGASSLR